MGGTYRRTLIGLPEEASIEKQAYRTASDYFDEPLGLYYGQTYFGEEAKKDVVAMVKEIIETYKKRMAKNKFLSAPTRKKAILKLDKIVIKMGYPDKVGELYDTLHFASDASFYDAVSALDEENRLFRWARLDQQVDRGEWLMPGHMSLSIGYYTCTDDSLSPDAAFARADEGLYRQKKMWHQKNDIL